MTAFRGLAALAMLAHQAAPPGNPHDVASAAAACTADIEGMGLSFPPALAAKQVLTRFDCAKHRAAGSFKHYIDVVLANEKLVPLPADFAEQAVLLTGPQDTVRYWLFTFKAGHPAADITLLVDQLGQIDEAEDVPAVSPFEAR